MPLQAVADGEFCVIHSTIPLDRLSTNVELTGLRGLSRRFG